jgi:hypothetical protein
MKSVRYSLRRSVDTDILSVQGVHDRHVRHEHLIAGERRKRLVFEKSEVVHVDSRLIEKVSDKL